MYKNVQFKTNEFKTLLENVLTKMQARLSSDHDINGKAKFKFGIPFRSILYYRYNFTIQTYPVKIQYLNEISENILA